MIVGEYAGTVGRMRDLDVLKYPTLRRINRCNRSTRCRVARYRNRRGIASVSKDTDNASLVSRTYVIRQKHTFAVCAVRHLKIDDLRAEVVVIRHRVNCGLQRLEWLRV